MSSLMKSALAAAALVFAIPVAATAEGIDVVGVWTFDKAASAEAMKELGVTGEAYDLAMSLLSSSAVVFDDELDAVTFLMDEATVVGVCTYEEAGDGALTLLECFDGEENALDAKDFGAITLYDDMTLSLEDEGYKAWYNKAE